MKTKGIALWMTLLGAGLAAAEVTPDRREVRIVLGRAPAYAALVEQKIRFLNPLPRGGGRSLVSPGGLMDSLNTEPVRIIVERGGRSSSAMDAEAMSVAFAKETLAPPGRYYPPSPPIGDSSVVRSIWFSSQVSEEAAAALLQSLAPVLGFDGANAGRWIENRLWENTGVFHVRGNFAEGASELTVHRRPGEAGFSVTVHMQWGEAPPRTRAPDKPE